MRLHVGMLAVCNLNSMKTAVTVCCYHMWLSRVIHCLWSGMIEAIATRCTAIDIFSFRKILERLLKDVLCKPICARKYFVIPSWIKKACYLCNFAMHLGSI